MNKLKSDVLELQASKQAGRQIDNGHNIYMRRSLAERESGRE